MDLKEILDTYDVDGVLHIGANVGQEYTLYGDLPVLYFEPLKEPFKVLQSRVGDRAINTALGNFTGETKMYVSDNNGVSSSILKPLLHLEQYPQIKFTEWENVKIVKLDDLETDGYNFINIDVQGYELEVFRGGELTLATSIDYILAEVNRVELYKGCPMAEELDKFLLKYGFTREETDWIGITWGDALYIK